MSFTKSPCQHDGPGWCFGCVHALLAERDQAREARNVAEREATRCGRICDEARAERDQIANERDALQASLKTQLQVTVTARAAVAGLALEVGKLRKELRTERTPSLLLSVEVRKLTYEELDAIVAADGRGWLETDGVIALFEALKARNLCVGEAPATPFIYTDVAFSDDEPTPVETPPLDRQISRAAITKARAALLEKRDALRQLPPTATVECVVCSGVSSELCGCEGVCTVEFALTFIDGELEILSK